MFPFDMPMPELVKDTIDKVLADHRAELFQVVREALQPGIDQATAQVVQGLRGRDIDSEFLQGYRGR